MSLIIAPLEGITDPRLSGPERRVLLALYSFRNKNADTVWPSAEAIAGRAGLRDKTYVSKMTKGLAEKGWLTKKRRGYTGGNEYILTVPEEAEKLHSNLEQESNLDHHSNLDEKCNSNLEYQSNSNLDYNSKNNEHQSEHQREECKQTPVDGKKSEHGSEPEQPHNSIPDQPIPPKPPAKKKLQTLDAWLDQIQADSEPAIAENDTIFDWCDKAGVPQDFVAACWQRFKDRYSGNNKTYRDWRMVFRNAVRDNWFKLWFVDGETGEVRATSVGAMALRVLNADQRRAG